MPYCECLWWLGYIYFIWISYFRIFHRMDATYGLSLPLASHSWADTPVFLAKPSVGFFTDYEIGSVYEVEILLFFFFNRSYSICCLILKKFLLWSSKIIHKTRETLQRTLICPPPSFDGYLQSANVVLLTPQRRMRVRMRTCVHWSILRKSLDVMSFFS